MAFMQDKMLPVDEIEVHRIAQELLKAPPEQGYLTISNALQWRLQYGKGDRPSWCGARHYPDTVNQWPLQRSLRCRMSLVIFRRPTLWQHGHARFYLAVAFVRRHYSNQLAAWAIFCLLPSSNSRG